MQKIFINPRNLYWLSFSILFLTPLANLGSDIYSPSLPHIMDYFNTNEYLVKMSVTIYLATYGLSQLILGFASDYCGRRNLVLSGICLFLVSSIAIVISNNIYILLGLRALQGIGAGSVSVITKAMISDVYSGNELKKMSNHKVSLQIASLVVAPFLGGVVQTLWGWQWNFIILFIYACIAIITCYFYVPETCACKNFTIHNLILDVINTLRDSKFILATLATTFIYSIAMVFPVCGTFFIQNILQYNSLIYGLMALILGCAYLLGSISHKYFNFNANLGLLIISMATLLVSLVIKNIYLAIFEFALIMFFTGCLLPIVMAHALAAFKLYPGVSNALFGTLVMLGTSIIIAIVSLFHISSYWGLDVAYAVLCLIEFLLVYKFLKIVL